MCCSKYLKSLDGVNGLNGGTGGRDGVVVSGAVGGAPQLRLHQAGEPEAGGVEGMVGGGAEVGGRVRFAARSTGREAFVRKFRGIAGRSLVPEIQASRVHHTLRGSNSVQITENKVRLLDMLQKNYILYSE